MAEFDDKLNALLGDPAAMAQIARLAQSLSGGQETAPPPSPPPQTQAQPAGNPLSALTGGVDPAMLMRLLPLIQELGGQQDSNARALLYALRPYLRPERRDKVERALQLARLFHIGKKFLAGGVKDV